MDSKENEMRDYRAAILRALRRRTFMYTIRRVGETECRGEFLTLESAMARATYHTLNGPCEVVYVPLFGKVKVVARAQLKSSTAAVLLLLVIAGCAIRPQYVLMVNDKGERVTCERPVSYANPGDNFAQGYAIESRLKACVKAHEQIGFRRVE